ncbi:serine/threonine-protein phosphatase 6 regulatory ankyrin repeat subunit C [Lingula anatina]|uniref:Serine/threonine-protein phosphatase 6 regulatory ankyrin repeat subunit C n=1 Tax=Lingula anatina TaxID=7574 RepID=A0A1S3H3B0_LINAN|nr:serine/threonine-protein phosphatase 6 regulatory ankyrin repeat subunit C [Lingula anatina]|eukprot:XP_013380620.1 serine/threonine-protein phosphatase 6 regulatory ankyrin repeat subunit C [Lingula anatina]
MKYSFKNQHLLTYLKFHMGNCVSSNSSNQDSAIFLQLSSKGEAALVLDNTRGFVSKPLFPKRRSGPESHVLKDGCYTHNDGGSNENDEIDGDDGERVSPNTPSEHLFSDIHSASISFVRGIHHLSIRSSRKWSNNWLSQPLHEAAYYGHQHVVDLFIDAGINLNGYDKGHNTALSLAAKRGHIHIVQRLVQAGCDVNAVNNGGNTVLHLMASTGDDDITELLLKAGADANIFNSQNHTPIYLALTHRNLAVLNKLIAGGANVHHQALSGQTYLHLAALDGFPQAVLQLLKNGAEFNVQDCNGNTPLILATKARCLKSMQYLLQFGCNPNLQNGLGKNAFHYATLAAPHADERALIMLLLAGAQIDKHDREMLSTAILGSQTASLLDDLLLSVPSLQQICRLAIRTKLKIPILPKVAMLPLPKVLKYYVILNDLGGLTR